MYAVNALFRHSSRFVVIRGTIHHRKHVITDANQFVVIIAMGVSQQAKSSSQERAACRSDQGVMGEEHESERYAAEATCRRLRHKGEGAYES